MSLENGVPCLQMPQNSKWIEMSSWVKLESGSGPKIPEALSVSVSPTSWDSWSRCWNSGPWTVHPGMYSKMPKNSVLLQIVPHLACSMWYLWNKCNLCLHCPSCGSFADGSNIRSWSLKQTTLATMFDCWCWVSAGSFYRHFDMIPCSRHTQIIDNDWQRNYM